LIMMAIDLIDNLMVKSFTMQKARTLEQQLLSFVIYLFF